MSESVPKAGKIERSLDNELRDLFWRFITKRQQVWYHRTIEESSPPWTEDEILQQNRFTNVYRRLDPGTQYVIQEILEKDASKQNKIFNVMVYRLIGRLKTHEYLGFLSLEDFNAVDFEEKLKHRRDKQNETVFTGAYMVAGYSQMGSSDKVENIAALFSEIASDTEYFDQLCASNSIEEAYDIILSQPGFGNFLAYQVLVDLLYPVEYHDGQPVLPFSANEWSSPGPGAIKGLKRLANMNEINRLDVMEWLHGNQHQEFERLNLPFPYLLDGQGEKVELTLADIQNCLCEFYKYHKILNSEGRARRRFRNSERRSSKELISIYDSAPGFCIEYMKDKN